MCSFFQLFFKTRVQDEDGYVLFVRKNALQILIPKYGLEGTLFLNASEKGAASLFTYDEEVKSLCVCLSLSLIPKSQLFLCLFVCLSLSPLSLWLFVCHPYFLSLALLLFFYYFFLSLPLSCSMYVCLSPSLSLFLSTYQGAKSSAFWLKSFFISYQLFISNPISSFCLFDTVEML